jgi:hypothetical protein
LNARRAALSSQARRLGLCIAALGVLQPSTPAFAQSWLPEADSYSVTFDTNDTYNKHHYDSRGRRGDFGHTRTFTEFLAAAWSVPFVNARYRGAFAHPVRVDDGEYHGTFTDLKVEARHQVIDGAFAMTPFVAIVTPTHDYDVLGHAAQGRGLNELWFGTYLGGNLDAWVPRTYVQVRLNYAFVEHVAGVKHDRINGDVEVGYFFSACGKTPTAASTYRRPSRMNTSNTTTSLPLRGSSIWVADCRGRSRTAWRYTPCTAPPFMAGTPICWTPACPSA